MFSDLISSVLLKKSECFKDLEKLEEVIKDFIAVNSQFSVIEPFILNKGKRIRSVLYFLNWKSQNSPFQKYKTAALIELIHFASIMHDDVIDDNFSRRNGDSFMKKYGRKKSILFGDFLLVKAIDELLKIFSKNDFAKNMCLRECSATAYGALLERMLTKNSSFQECLKVASLKTGSLFKLSCFLGKYLSTGNFEDSKRSAIYGLCFGTLFQIQNDLDSYKFENFEDSEDYIQKNITVPLIILRDHFNLDISKFDVSNQKNYDEIRKSLHSSEFESTSKKLLAKLIECVVDFSWNS